MIDWNFLYTEKDKASVPVWKLFRCFNFKPVHIKRNFPVNLFSHPPHRCTFLTTLKLLIDLYFVNLIYKWTCENVARVLNSIFSKWSIKADQTQWNISGELCSGRAIDDSAKIDDTAFDPFIKCDCSFNNKTTCRITALYYNYNPSFLSICFVSITLFNTIFLKCNRKVYSLDVVGEIPPELWTLVYLTNLYVLFAFTFFFN
jgi:hypothetical protein